MYEKKVKYLSARNLRAYLSAMEKLLSHYESKEVSELLYHCPFCNTLRELSGSHYLNLTCSAKKVRCPWYVFTEDGCVAAAKSFLADLSYRLASGIYALSSKSAYRWGNEKDKEITGLWVEKRVKELGQWIEVYKAELSRRKK